jgi:hypothetical protein
MTRAELIAGFRRLALIVLALLALVLLAAAGAVAAFGGSFRSRLGGALAIVALLLMFGGIGTYLRAGPLRREGPPLHGTYRVVEADERRSAEFAAGGLLALGIALFVLALVVQ